MREILIINGSGGVGKDTFVECLAKCGIKVLHTSIVNPVKDLARRAGWSGSKNEVDRKFLSDLKVLIDDYNDGNYRQMESAMRRFRNGEVEGDILCIDMREKHQIERAKNDFGAKSVLVVRDSVKHITSNIADAGVFDIKYDYVIDNSGSIEDLEKTAKDFVDLLAQSYEKVIYISHPYQGKSSNLGEIEDIANQLIQKYPNYLILSPVHSFGYHYNSMDYNKGLKECLWLLKQADEVWVYGDYENSTGCMAEIEFAHKNRIPCRIFGERGVRE